MMEHCNGDAYLMDEETGNQKREAWVLTEVALNEEAQIALWGPASEL